MWNGFLLQKGWIGTTPDPCPRRLLPLKTNNTYSFHEHHWGWRGKEWERQCPEGVQVSCLMQNSLSNQPGVSGGTGVMVAKEGL